jgi:hypothetical protein
MYEIPFQTPGRLQSLLKVHVIHIPNLTLNFSAKLRGLLMEYVYFAFRPIGHDLIVHNLFYFIYLKYFAITNNTDYNINNRYTETWLGDHHSSVG